MLRDDKVELKSSTSIRDVYVFSLGLTWQLEKQHVTYIVCGRWDVSLHMLAEKKEINKRQHQSEHYFKIKPPAKEVHFAV